MFHLMCLFTVVFLNLNPFDKKSILEVELPSSRGKLDVQIQMRVSDFMGHVLNH
jgi:hypothetical protein